MKRFLLFGYNQYYPRGGWYDLQGSFDRVEGAIEAARKGDSMVTESGFDWWHVTDTEQDYEMCVSGHGSRIVEATNPDAAKIARAEAASTP